MYRYAISVPDSRIPIPEWQNAIANARLKRIEFSCATNCMEADFDFNEKVAILAKLQAEGKVIVGSVHIPFGGGWEFADVNEDKRVACVNRTINFLRACIPLNCKEYTMHGCLEPVKPEEREDAIKSIRQTLTDLLPIAREMNIHINVEILPRSCLANTAEELKRIVDGLPTEIGVCFDVNHLCNHPEKLYDSILLLADRIHTFHISDYDGVDECHWYPCLGVIDWVAVMNAVKQLPNDVLLMFETSGFLKPPVWQKRDLDYTIEFNAAEHNIFLLENIAEIKKRTAETPIL